MDTRQKACSNREQDKACFAGGGGAGCFAARKVISSYVFDQRVPLMFHFSQPSGIFLRIVAKNILLSENKSSRLQPPTPNFECFAAKHFMFAQN